MTTNQKTKRLFRVSVLVEVESDTKEQGEAEAKKTVELLGVKADTVEYVKSRRSLQQNASLWLLFTQLANELNARGLDMRAIIRKEVEISWTPENINHFLWKPLLKALTGKKSTTQMDKTGDIEIVYDNLNRIIAERTQGEVSLPPWPSLETMIDESRC